MAQGMAKFIEQLGLLMEADGLPRIAGRILGALLLAPEPESLDDLARQLAVSRASIRANARLLEQRRLIERVTAPGDRRGFYRTAPDLFRVSMEDRLRRWSTFHEAVAEVRRSGALLDIGVCARLDRLDGAYRHMLAWTAEALDSWDRSYGTKRARKARQQKAPGAAHNMRGKGPGAAAGGRSGPQGDADPARP